MPNRTITLPQLQLVVVLTMLGLIVSFICGLPGHWALVALLTQLAAYLGLTHLWNRLR